ncbi:MAG: hypothetical protein N4A71_24505 [Carboxylicivirga sp.]|jgi:hypothetical protein|nr:hypothetical protein [Carboxylicivirga sp.]
MKKVLSNLLLPAVLLLSSFSIQGQTVVVDHSHCYSKHFKLGEMYYSASFKGLKMLMRDVHKEDPELHAIILPSYNNLVKKRKSAMAVGITANSVGGFLVLGSFTFLQSTETETSIFSPGDSFYKPPHDVKTPNIGLMATGGLIMIAGSIVAVLLHPGEQDFYDFINIHNKNSKDRKLDWNLGLDCTSQHPLGLSLQMRF